MHVAPLEQGGHSGRPQIFVVGLDDSRYPQRAAIDPILLDAERNRLSERLQTSQHFAQLQQQALHRALFRVLADSGAKVHSSYSSRNLADDRPSFPSSSMLEIFRITSGNDDAHMDDLLKVLRQICDLIKSGVFVATTDPADCKFCDYLSVCRYPDFIAAASLQKALETCNREILKPWIQLRELDQQTESAR